MWPDKELKNIYKEYTKDYNLDDVYKTYSNNDKNFYKKIYNEIYKTTKQQVWTTLEEGNDEEPQISVNVRIEGDKLVVDEEEYKATDFESVGEAIYRILAKKMLKK